MLGTKKNGAGFSACPLGYCGLEGTAVLSGLEYEAQGNLHTARVGAVGEALGSVAVAHVRHAASQHRLQNVAGNIVGEGLDERVVDGVEGIESFKRQVRLHALAERQAA